MIRKEFNKYEIVQSCDLCGSNRIDEYFPSGNIVKCQSCDFLFVSPRPSMDEIKKSYSDTGFYDGWKRESEGRLKMWQKRYKRIKKYIKSSSNILDYSAGIGTFMDLAKLNGQNVYGTELSDSAKKIAAEQYDLKLYDSDHYFKSDYHNYFDVVTAWHVVEHVASPRTLIENFFEILKPGGYLIVAIPNAQEIKLRKLFIKQDLNNNYHKQCVGDEIHLSHFDKNTIVRLLKSVKYSIVKIGIDDHYPTSNMRNRTKHYLYELIYKLTDKNYSPTIFIVAKK